MKERLELTHEDLCRVLHRYLRTEIYTAGAPLRTATPRVLFIVDDLTPEGEPITVKPRVIIETEET